MRKTNELLVHSLMDIHADSLENRISVNDLAVVQDVGTSVTDSQEIKNISQKELDVDLSNFRLT